MLVGLYSLIHLQPRLVGLGLAYDLGGNAGNCGVRRNFVENHAAGGDLGALADLDVAEDLGSGPNQYALPHFGMTIASLLAGATQRHFMKHGNVITDHRSFRAYEEACPMAEALGILLIRGMETGINGNEHLVALDFSADYEPRNPHQWAEIQGQSQVFYRDQLQRLSTAGAYVLYAHPHVGLREPVLWAIGQGIIRGIEVKNDVVGSGWNTVASHGTWWYPFAFDWAVEHGLTLFANSDVHGARGNVEQAVTLVLARERSIAGVMEALRAGRTLASFNNMLCAHEWVLELLMANMVDVRLNQIDDGITFLRLQNSGPKELTAEIEGIPVGPVTLGAYQTALIGLRRKPAAVTMTWKNLYTRPTTNLTTTHILTGPTR